MAASTDDSEHAARAITSPWVNSRRWFLAGLALVYFVAFASLSVQIVGLVGERGIEPVANWLGAVEHEFGASSWHVAPTLLWLDASDLTLRLWCGAGALFALLLFFDIAPGWSAFACWLVYLSLTVGGGDFLEFQWDSLLLETGAIAIFYAPWRLRRAPDLEEEPSRLARFAVWWLLARLMFESGWVKVASDSHWRDLSALDFHFETQPLPTPLALFAHHAGAFAHRAACAATLAIELALPFAILCGRLGRRIACAGFALLQLLIAASGNYGFFNLLSLVLALALLDDLELGRLLPFARQRPIALRALGYSRRMLIQIFVGIAGLVSAAELAEVLADRPIPDAWRAPIALVEPLRSFNSYGLFRVMTLERPEITLEGTLDGATWKPYRFRYQVDEPDRAPPFVAPHMPRLDWQMWFAALGDFERTPWFEGLVLRLLQASPDVLALFAADPFDGRAPIAVRARVANFHFSAAGSPWWTQDAPREWLPPVELDGQGGLKLVQR